MTGLVSGWHPVCLHKWAAFFNGNLPAPDMVLWSFASAQSLLSLQSSPSVCVSPALKRGEDLLMGLVGLLKTWQVTGTNKYVSRLSEDWTCWTSDPSNLNPEGRLLEQHRGPNPGSTGSLPRGRRGWGGNAGAHRTCAPAAREIKWGQEWLTQSGRMDTSEKAGGNACVIC